jgi:small subunit ribosomal protein S1
VDLGGIDGLLHISELAWKYIKNPHEVLAVGDSVEVYIVSVDRERERIGLSRRRLLPDPWFTVTQGLQQGNVAEGTVTRISRFGAFVDLGQGVLGLVHISEIPDGMIADWSLMPESPIKVRVLRVDNERRRISLSLAHTENVASLPAERPHLQEAPPRVKETADQPLLGLISSGDVSGITPESSDSCKLEERKTE